MPFFSIAQGIHCQGGKSHVTHLSGVELYGSQQIITSSNGRLIRTDGYSSHILCRPHPERHMEMIDSPHLTHGIDTHSTSLGTPIATRTTSLQPPIHGRREQRETICRMGSNKQHTDK